MAPPATLMPQRIQLRRTKGWRMPPNTISVARPSYWGNPWHVGVDGNAQECVDEFYQLVSGRPVARWPLDAAEADRAIRFVDIEFIRAELAGKNLACWCALDQPCHADVLLKVANPAVKVRVLSDNKNPRVSSEKPRGRGHVEVHSIL